MSEPRTPDPRAAEVLRRLAEFARRLEGILAESHPDAARVAREMAAEAETLAAAPTAARTATGEPDLPFSRGVNLEGGCWRTEYDAAPAGER